jgi:hypothetical protein
VLCLLAMALARSVRSCLSPLEIASVTISVLVLSSSSFELFDAPFEDVIPPPLSAAFAARSSESDVFTMGVTGGRGVSAGLGVRNDACGVTCVRGDEVMNE